MCADVWWQTKAKKQTHYMACMHIAYTFDVNTPTCTLNFIIKIDTERRALAVLCAVYEFRAPSLWLFRWCCCSFGCWTNKQRTTNAQFYNANVSMLTEHIQHCFSLPAKRWLLCIFFHKFLLFHCNPIHWQDSIFCFWVQRLLFFFIFLNKKIFESKNVLFAFKLSFFVADHFHEWCAHFIRLNLIANFYFSIFQHFYRS